MAADARPDGARSMILLLLALAATLLVAVIATLWVLPAVVLAVLATADEPA